MIDHQFLDYIGFIRDDRVSKRSTEFYMGIRPISTKRDGLELIVNAEDGETYLQEYDEMRELKIIELGVKTEDQIQDLVHVLQGLPLEDSIDDDDDDIT